MYGKTLSKLKSVIVLVLVALMSLSLILFAACGKKADDKEEDKTYTKVEHDEQELTNGNFEFGTVSVKPENYPYTSVNGWSRAVDNSAASSRVDSGVIDTAEWDKLLDKLLENTTFKTWAKKTFETELKAAANDALKTDDEATPADGEINEWIDKAENIKDVIAKDGAELFANPGNAPAATGTDKNAAGKKVFMLNNYSTDYGKGTAQKVTSSKTFTLKPDTYGEFSVYVKTDKNMKAFNGTNGANIRLTNTVSSVTQDEYKISNINTNGEWVKYTIKVKANDFADSTVKLVLGLGYGDGNSTTFENAVEGTAYFDEAVYTEHDEMNDFPVNADKITLVSEASTEKKELTAVSDKVYALDLASDSRNEFFGSEAVTATKTAGDDATFNSTATGFTVNHAAKAASTVKLTSSSFSVQNGGYVAVNFKLKMTLDKFQKKGLTAYVYDEFGGNTNHAKTLDNVIIEEDGYYTVFVKNNFKEGGARTFYIDFMFGPTDPAKTTDPTEFTSGSYEVSDIKVTSGLLESEADKTHHTLYTLISGVSTNTYSVAAYAGFTEDFTETEENENYSFRVAYSDEGTITSAPAKAANYTGVADYDKTYLQTKPDGTVAGLINTKYASAYQDYVNALGWTEGKDNVQPLMIYNANKTSYGYVNSSATVAADSQATVSVRVKAVGDAVAYLYLVSTKQGADMLDVLTQSFTPDGADEAVTNRLEVKIDSGMMSDKDGWTTVTFYIEAGKDPISYRLEMWNGARYTNVSETDTPTANENGSVGYVFFDNVTVGSSIEADFVQNAIASGKLEEDMTLEYTRKLTELEKKFNKEQKKDEDKISYDKGVVWASNVGDGVKADKIVYATYKTINPTETDPYGTPDDDGDNDDKKTGCNSVDASTLALSISSIVLAVVLVAAIIAVVVKTLMRKRKANKSDAKSHYKVTSRNKTHNAVKAKAKKAEQPEETAEDEEPEELEEVEEVKEEYTYGEVLEDFGDDEEPEAEENADGDTTDDKE